MGFRTGAFAKVWASDAVSDTMTKLRISTSRKNKKTEQYEQDFSGFVMCIGTAVASKGLLLNEGDTIKIGDCDVTSKYDKEKQKTYTNFTIFSFEPQESSRNNNQTTSPSVDDGEVSDELDDRELPFEIF